MYARITPMLLAPALLLASCGTGNVGLESIHQPVVQRADYVFDVQTSGYGLASGEAQRLAGWMDTLRLRYGDRIAIDDGADGYTGRAEIAEQANRYGLLLTNDRAPITSGAVTPGTVRVIVTRMHAEVPDCPTGRNDPNPDFVGATGTNYGCAINSNLAAMVADPVDLVRGVPGAPTSDPATGTKAIRALRDAAPTGGGGTVVKTESAASGGSQ